MHFRTGGDGKLTELSQYEKDTMVFLCQKRGAQECNPLFGKLFQLLKCQTPSLAKMMGCIFGCGKAFKIVFI